MANRTAWTAGNGAGLAWATAINTGDLATLPNGSTVLSTVADITNGTALDQFMDVSVRCAIASSTIIGGSNLALWLYYLLDDGTSYGDGQLVAGTQKAATPVFTPAGTIPLLAAAAQTLLIGVVTGIVIAPGSFRLALQNNSGFAFSGTQNVKYRTYNINLNN